MKGNQHETRNDWIGKDGNEYGQTATYTAAKPERVILQK
jgi:hypothetical protein